MDMADFSALAGERRDRFFARSVGTDFSAKADDDGTLAIDLYDEIGYWGTTAKAFRAVLKQATGDIKLRVNSPGGDVMDGMAIYADLEAHKKAGHKVSVEISGIAASIASIIAMAGTEIVMAPGAFMMVHNAWTIGVGNRHDFADVAATLTKIDDVLAHTYASRTKGGIRSIKQMMDDETWLTAKEALAQGFATSIEDSADSGTKAKYDLSVFHTVPKALLWNDDGADEDIVPTKRDVERALTRDAGWSRTKARAATRTPDTSTPELKRDADVVDLTPIAAALARAKAAFHHTTT